MATGPEHYAEAQELLATIRDQVGVRENPETATALAVVALAHATLALAAATALAGVTLQLPASSDLAAAWNEAIGVPGVTP